MSKRKELRIQMLGGFSMYYGEEAIALNKIGKSKSLRLLQMLLLSRPGGISKSELMDNLYGWTQKTTMANGNKNLNNLIYRLKGQLSSCGLPQEEYVEIREGMCYFKTEIPIKLDTLEFEKTIQSAKDREGVKRLQLLREANEQYHGELLPGNLSDTWFYYRSRYYKELYTWVLGELEQIFLEQKDYQDCTLYKSSNYLSF